MLIAGLVAAMLFQEPGKLDELIPKGCELPKGVARAVAFIELPERVGARDSVVDARICLRTRDSKLRIGSYHGVVTWDSTKATLREVKKGRRGMRLENTTKAGVVDFAGAFPSGLDERSVMTLELTLAKPGKLPPLTLHMFELNEVSGTVLTSTLSVTGYPATLKTTPGALKKNTNAAGIRGADSAKKTSPAGNASPTAPTAVEITGVSPAEPRAGSEVVVRGKGFMPVGNTLLIGAIEIRDLPSADGGTLIRFTLPTERPARSEAGPKVVGAGQYTVTVKNARGTSNTLRFTVRD